MKILAIYSEKNSEAQREEARGRKGWKIRNEGENSVMKKQQQKKQEREERQFNFIYKVFPHGGTQCGLTDTPQLGTVNSILTLPTYAGLPSKSTETKTDEESERQKDEGNKGHGEN